MDDPSKPVPGAHYYTYAYTISSGIISCHIVQPRAKLNADRHGQSNSLICLFLLCYSF